MHIRPSRWSGVQIGLRASLAIGLACAAATARAEVPPEVIPPQGNVETVRAYAQGFQVYTAVPRPEDSSQLQWVLKAPDATLYNHGGQLLGWHYGGPTWEARNGSKVIGARVSSAPSPNPDSIPLLLLEAVSHAGHGMLSKVTYIQRLDTVGGLAPAEAPTVAGAEVSVPYTATYVFYKSGGPKKSARQ